MTIPRGLLIDEVVNLFPKGGRARFGMLVSYLLGHAVSGIYATLLSVIVEVVVIIGLTIVDVRKRN
jgi:hypothetical protein